MNGGAYERISRNKGFLMGLAILWMVMFHSAFTFSGKAIYWPAQYFFKTIGYGSVDIFMLLSGFGLYGSLKRNPDTGRFYRNRAWRLLPSYVPFILCWILLTLATDGITLPEALGNLFATGWWMSLEHQFNWYAQAIFLFYLAAPALFLLADRANKPGMLLLVGGAVLFGVPFLNKIQLMAVSRLPVYLLGMLFARAWQEGKEMPLWGEILCYALLAVGFAVPHFVLKYVGEWAMWRYGLWWYPTSLAAPGLCLLAGRAGDACRRCFLRYPVRLAERIGGATFEIYLIQIVLYDYVQRYTDLNTRTMALLLVATVAAGMGYHALVTLGIKRLRRC